MYILVFSFKVVVLKFLSLHNTTFSITLKKKNQIRAPLLFLHGGRHYISTLTVLTTSNYVVLSYDQKSKTSTCTVENHVGYKTVTISTQLESSDYE